MISLDNSNPILPIGERVAIVETKVSTMQVTLDSIEGKLDDLLKLKDKGMGALSLVSMVGLSGLLAIIAVVWQFLSGRSHL